ncbi:MAG: FKBP-type peptidyl-prolyl cis-trans isomerase [Treponema sp.]|jgi:FKBP-type peptidyl-prolyl cis-trans isomerase|nr:FKBP-type peptidyl-prolyl cis-trans isomerase [Treponema sp.]
MKKTICALALVLGLSLFVFAEGIAEEAAAGSERADVSYAFGMAIGSDLKQSGLKFNYSAFTRGFREMMENQETRFTLDEAVGLVQTAFQAAMAEQAEYNRLREEEFLAENAKRPGIITTSSGLQYEILEEGTGPAPEISDFVRVHYRGAFLDGRVFDSSYDRGEPDEFPLQGVIPGWSEGILLIKTGGKSRLYIPSKLAYGVRGAGNNIPPNAALIFEVELLDILEQPLEDFFNPED